MPLLQLETLVRAAPRRCFDLSRDIGAHQASMAGSKELVVAGRTSGLLEPGEQVT